MHIPDGYLSPATSATMFAAAAPFWYVAATRVKRALTHRTVPVLALFAAFVFVLMMFNIPLPGGTTGHAVGGTLLAIVLGPWAAIVGMSVVLGIQALFFGDGGLMTLGANCFNMAIVLPLAGYFVYRVIAGRSDPASPRRLAGAVAGAYVGMLAAAALTATELGVQPALFHAADGTPLYAPYSINVAMPAVLIGHILIAGPVEALVTGLAIGYLQRTRSSLLFSEQSSGGRSGRLWPLWAVVAVLALATPIGLLASGTAWGEWSTEQLTNAGLGFVPQGLARIEGWWPALLPGYGLARAGAVVGYLTSAVLGVALVAVLLWVVGRKLTRQTERHSPAKPARGKPAGDGFLIRTVSAIAGALDSAMKSESLAREDGFFQGLDARVKFVTVVFFIILVGLTHSLLILAAIGACVFLLAASSKLPPLLFSRRVLVFLPFTVVVALPALFITRGDPLVSMGTKALITTQGLRTASFLALRVLDSVALGGLLILTTPWNSFLSALRWIRVPSVVVAVLGMTYRYIFLLLHTASSMFMARRSRTVGGLSAAENRRWLGRTVAVTLAKSQHLSEEVYLAMVSRGYRGSAVSLRETGVRTRDFVWLGASAAAVALLIWRVVA